MSKLNLHTVLKASYADNKTQKKELKKHGYYRDKKLSNDNQQTYYNPQERKLLFSVSGTHNLKDIGTDIYLGLGKIKDTSRYNEAKTTLEKAKKKYAPNNTVVAGHSLGGNLSQYIAGKNDKIFTLNSGYTIGQPSRGNDYRIKGDIVSSLNSKGKNVHNIDKNKYYNPLKAHDVDNIKHEKIFL